MNFIPTIITSKHILYDPTVLTLQTNMFFGVGAKHLKYQDSEKKEQSNKSLHWKSFLYLAIQL